MYIIYRIKYLTIGAAPVTGQIQPFDSLVNGYCFQNMQLTLMNFTYILL